MAFFCQQGCFRGDLLRSFENHFLNSLPKGKCAWNPDKDKLMMFFVSDIIAWCSHFDWDHPASSPCGRELNLARLYSFLIESDLEGLSLTKQSDRDQSHEALPYSIQSCTSFSRNSLSNDSDSHISPPLISQLAKLRSSVLQSSVNVLETS